MQEIQATKDAIEAAQETLERATRERERREAERDSHARLARELRDRRPHGRSGIPRAQR